MQHIDSDRYHLLRQIFNIEPGPQTASFFIDRLMGDAFLEKEKNPAWGMICHNEDMVIRGNLITDDLLELIQKYDFKGLLEVESKFESLVKKCFPDAVEWERVSYVSKYILPKIDFREVEIRMLRKDDEDGLLTVGEKWLWKYFKNPENLVVSMPTAGCFSEGELVSVCSVFTESSEYADIGVITKANTRGMNFGTACSAFLSHYIMENIGKKVVWNTSPDNPSSVRIAEKLGFEEYELKTSVMSTNNCRIKS